MSVLEGRDQLVGRALGEFVLRERIGQGGFGAVYRATQAALDREAVIKVLHSELHASPAVTERFLREAKLASKLDHPYAAHVYAFGAEPDGELWIAMELVRGTPLDQVLKSQGPLPLERFVPLLDRICEVVHTAHEQGIVHRDLKPANVMVLARAGRLLPKLLDFGIAKGLAAGADAEPDIGGDSTVRVDRTALAIPNDLVEPTAQTAQVMATPVTPQVVGLTQRGALMGSPLYMAPEQWLDAGRVDARTDLYALGVLAYECLVGKPPFTGKTLTEIAQAHAKQVLAPLGSRFPGALDVVFAKVLAKKAPDRYPDALAFAAAFREASGVAATAIPLPALDPAQRDAAKLGAPQPIAEAVAALEAARNAHQARDAMAQLARTITRYLGLLALACRSRVSGGDEPSAVSDALRTLYRRSLGDREWLDLARQLTSVWLTRRDAYPIPELIDACHDTDVTDALEALVALRDREVASEEALVELLAREVARLGKLLARLAFLADYSLVVTAKTGAADRWMGVRQMQRTTTPVRGKQPAVDVAMLLDPEGTPVLSLEPLFQIAPPTPGAAPELFLFDGRDTRGAKLVALPAGFERHDDGLWDWFRAQLSGSLDERVRSVVEETSPYLGLTTFSAADGANFFGREKLVDAFCNRLKLQPLLAIVGGSGAGKSSFVYAGVVPALGWRTITMRPGASPIDALIARLEHAGLVGLPRAAVDRNRDALGDHLRADAARRGSLLLVVDQLEELFTLCHDPLERRAFAEAIAAAARDAADPVRVIFTLRDDFLMRTDQVPALRNRIGQGLQLLTVPIADDLLRILVEPARRAGYEFEDAALPDEMVKEVADQPGALPLISFTAAKLWELRDRHFKQLTRAAYKTLGGVGGALARHADITYDALPPEERALAREAFRHLVTSQHTRTVVARSDLRQLLGGSSHADRVVEQLIGARLLVASEDEAGGETIEIVHEALLSAWPRLVEWQREDADGARFREQLRAAAAQWQDRERAEGLLWRGDALADFTRWRVRHPGPLTDVEAAFADDSLTDAARGRRARRVLLAASFTMLVVIVVGLVVFTTRIAGQRRELHDNLERQYEDQGRRLVLAADPLPALAYLAKAQEFGAHGPSHEFLVAQAVQATNGELLEVRHENAIRSPRFSHDGTRLITGGFDHKAHVWDARTGKLLLTLPHNGVVMRASFAPDDSTVLTGSFDGTAVVWDARTGAPLQRVQHETSGELWCAVYSPDGQLAMVGGDDDVLEVRTVATGVEKLRVHGEGAGVSACAFAPDGKTIAAGDAKGTTRLWGFDSGRLVHELRGQRDRIHDLAFSPEGERLATASLDGTAVEWNVADGQQLHTFAHHAAVQSVEFSPDGELVVTASNDHTASVWDARDGARRLELAGQVDGLGRAAFSPDGKYIVTTSNDSSAWLWDASSGRVVARWRGHEDRVVDAAFDPSGTRVVTSGDDGRAIVWRVAPQEQITRLLGHHDVIWWARFSRDGTRVVTASQDGTARVWDARTGTALAVLRGHVGPVTSAVFSPDGSRIVTRGGDGSVRVWDAAGVQPPKILTSAKLLTNAPSEPDGVVAWSADGTTIAAGSFDGWIRCWNANTGALRFERRGHGDGNVFDVSFAPTSSTLATTGDDLTTRFWNLDGVQLAAHRDPDAPVSGAYDPSGQRMLSVVNRLRVKIWNVVTGIVETELVGHVGVIVDAEWSPDGLWVVTASSDGTARVWDAMTGDAIAVFTYPGRVLGASFSPDGGRVVIAHDDGSATIHTLPRHAPNSSALTQLLRCRVPFEIQGDRLAPRDNDVCTSQ